LRELLQHEYDLPAHFDGTTAMNLNIENFLAGGLENEYNIDHLCLAMEHCVAKNAVDITRNLLKVIDQTLGALE
jgi:hypothetical protein